MGRRFPFIIKQIRTLCSTQCGRAHTYIVTQHTAARAPTLIDPSRDRTTQRRCHSPSRPLHPFRNRPQRMIAVPAMRTQQSCDDNTRSRVKVIPRSTHFVPGYAAGIQARSTKPHLSSLALPPAPTFPAPGPVASGGLWLWDRIVPGSQPTPSTVLLRLRVHLFSTGLWSQFPARTLNPVGVRCRFGLPLTCLPIFGLRILNLRIGNVWCPLLEGQRFRDIREYKQRVFVAHNATGCSMRVMRAIYEHRSDTCDNALSFVLRAESKVTPLMPDLHHAYPVCIRLQNLGNLC